MILIFFKLGYSGCITRVPRTHIIWVAMRVDIFLRKRLLTQTFGSNHKDCKKYLFHSCFIKAYAHVNDFGTNSRILKAY